MGERVPRWKKAVEAFKAVKGRASLTGRKASGGSKGRRGRSSESRAEAGDVEAGEFGDFLGRPSLGGEGLGWSEASGSGSDWSAYGTAEDGSDVDLGGLG